MKALLLVGGMGSRLRPFTHTTPKQLIPVANKPIILYALEQIRSAGIREIGVVVGDTRAEIMAALGDGSQWGVQITYIEQDRPRGIAHAVWEAKEFTGEQPFLTFLGDNLLQHGVDPLVRRFSTAQPDAMVVLKSVADPHRLGVAEVENGQIVRLIEKPRNPATNLAVVGVYLFTPRIYDAISVIRPSPRQELELTDAIQELISQGGQVLPHFLDGWWMDTGMPADLLHANRLALDAVQSDVAGSVSADSRLTGAVVVAPTAQITGSVIEGPVVIGAEAVIRDSYVGPHTAVGERVTLVRSHIRNTVLLEGASVLHPPRAIEQSIIGRDAVVSGTEAEESATGLQLILGDSSYAALGGRRG